MNTECRAGKQRGGPLQGVRVVELTKVWAGPYVGKQLAYMGAEVIRVESEGSLDVTRTFGVDDINNAPGWQSVNPEKLSVQINMKSARGIELILELVRQADIVVENLRPGAIDRLGLGYDIVKEANPSIIYVSMGMHGNQGPLSYQTGYAPCFAALSGLTALVGYEGEAPAGMNVRYADSTFGTAAAYASLVALYHQRKTGEGQFIDVSAVETMSSMIGDTLIDYTLNGALPVSGGNRHREMAPHGVYRCSDGSWIALAVQSEDEWSALANHVGGQGLATDAQFAALKERKANEDALDKVISDWCAKQDAKALVESLQGMGIAASKSFSSLDMIGDETLWARGFYREVVDHAGRARTTLGPGWKMERGADISAAAPVLGQHNDYVLGEILGLSNEERKTLGEAGITR